MQKGTNRWALQKPTKNVWQMLGPSLLLVALAISGGELLLWPDLVSRYGFAFLWTVPLILILQFAVNMEIERYTAVTGETTLGGLVGLSKWFRLLFPISIVVSLVWPAWASPAGNMLAHTFGVPGQGALFGMGIMLMLILIWNSKNSYKILETVARYGLLVVLGIILWVIGTNWDPQIMSEAANGFTSIGYFPPETDKFVLLSALAYGGVVGVLNLAQSDWTKAKGYAAAGREDPSLVNWELEETQSSWKNWWSLMLKEHFVVYYIGNFVGIILLSILAFVTIRGLDVKNFAILTAQFDQLREQTPILGIAFGLGITLLFTMAQMTILDAQGRLLKTSLQSKISNEKISQFVGVIGLIILLMTYINPDFNQPAFLLRLSASLSAGVMVMYAPFLLVLNNKLPEKTRPKLWNKLLVIGCAVFYGIIIVWSLLGSPKNSPKMVSCCLFIIYPPKAKVIFVDVPNKSILN
ncbi:Nramp family divalent metal transporter [Candidatus Gracilibacteria bacterium]|nr:Nramp family divalent metal transporter [Candidatus Gracilibacteria bacterium]